MNRITRIFILLLLAVFTYGTAPTASAQKRKTTKKVEKVKELTPEELAAQELAERRAKRIEEMLESTRCVTFIDSAVVDKDAFLTQLRLTSDAGHFTRPQTLFADETGEKEMGEAAFVNSLSNTVYFSAVDTTGIMSLFASYRNGMRWSTPQVLAGLDGYDNPDYPFLLSDGVTLYFAALGEESIGGYDIFATRYNRETRQYVRPENVGFPFNSTANDYLLAIDENAGVGALVTDRRQPDDKVCIYWFVAESNFDNYEYDEDEDEEVEHVRQLAEIASISQSVRDRDAANAALSRWHEILDSTDKTLTKHYYFVVNDNKVYHSFDEFKSAEARALAERWQSESEQYAALSRELQQLRADYAITRSKKTGQRILNLEVQTSQLTKSIHELAKSYRAKELSVSK